MLTRLLVLVVTLLMVPAWAAAQSPPVEEEPGHTHDEPETKEGAEEGKEDGSKVPS